MKRLFTFVLVTAAAFAAEGYHVLNKIKIGGTGGWDYVTVDSTGTIVRFALPNIGAAELGNYLVTVTTPFGTSVSPTPMYVQCVGVSG